MLFKQTAAYIAIQIEREMFIYVHNPFFQRVFKIKQIVLVLIQIINAK